MTESVFRLHASKIFFWYLFCVHIFALICFWLSFNTLLFSILFMLTFISFVFFLKQGNSRSHVSLVFTTDQQWKIDFLNNHVETVELLGNSVIARYFCMLYFKSESNNKHFKLLVFKDSVQKNLFKTLKRCARISRISYYG